MAITKLVSNVGGKARKARDAREAKAAARAKAVAPARRVTLGIIVGNRGFFPGHLEANGRNETLKALEAGGVDVVLLDSVAPNPRDSAV